MASKEEELTKRADIKSRQVLLEDVRTKRYSKSFSYVPSKAARALNFGVGLDICLHVTLPGRILLR